MADMIDIVQTIVNEALERYEIDSNLSVKENVNKALELYKNEDNHHTRQYSQEEIDSWNAQGGSFTQDEILESIQNEIW